MKQDPLDYVLESFDQADTQARREIVLEMLRQMRVMENMIKLLADRVAAQSELLRRMKDEG